MAHVSSPAGKTLKTPQTNSEYRDLFEKETDLFEKLLFYIHKDGVFPFFITRDARCVHGINSYGPCDTFATVRVETCVKY
jgi:hypothetical protein